MQERGSVKHPPPRPMHPLRPESSRNKVSGWWWGARSSYSEWLGIWWGDLSKIGNRRRITAGKQAGEQSNLEAGLFFELCGREATVYMQSCWLKTLRIGWRVEGFKSRSTGCQPWVATLGCPVVFGNHTLCFMHVDQHLELSPSCSVRVNTQRLYIGLSYGLNGHPNFQLRPGRNSGWKWHCRCYWRGFLPYITFPWHIPLSL